MAGETRKYHVQHIDEATGKVVRERIIQAGNRAVARSHASNTTIAVELLDTDNAIRLGGLKIPTEVADGAKATALKAHPDQLSLPGTSVDPDGGVGAEGSNTGGE